MIMSNQSKSFRYVLFCALVSTGLYSKAEARNLASTTSEEVARLLLAQTKRTHSLANPKTSTAKIGKELAAWPGELSEDDFPRRPRLNDSNATQQVGKELAAWPGELSDEDFPNPPT